MTPPPHDHESCRRMFERLSEFLDGELDAAACEEIRRHADHCQACRVCLQTLRRTVDLCHHLDSEPVPPSLQQSLQRLARDLLRQKTAAPDA